MAEKLGPVTLAGFGEQPHKPRQGGNGHAVFDALVRAVQGGAIRAEYDATLPIKSPFIVYPGTVVDKDRAQEEINIYGAQLENAGVGRKKARELTERLRSRFNGGTIYEQQAVADTVGQLNRSTQAK